MSRARPRTCVFLLLAVVATLVFAAPASAEPGDLAPTWESELTSSEAYLEGEQQKLADAREELEEAQADGDSSFAASRQERVDHYAARVAAAQAQVTAAEAGLEKQNELDEKGEPQDQLREIKESISYYETLRKKAQGAGDTATAGDATAELEGGYMSPGLYELQEKAEKERAAKEAAKNVVGGETNEATAETNEETTEETTTAAPAPGGGAGGGNQPAEAAPEPTPNEPEPGTETNSGPGIGVLFGDVNPVPILVFGLLVAGGIFALSRAGGMSIRGFLSPAMASVKSPAKPKPKKKTKTTAKAATKPETGPTPPEIEGGNEPEERREMPSPEPEKSGGSQETNETTAEELDEIFGWGDDTEKDEDNDETPPD